MPYTLPVSHHGPKLLRELQSPATRANMTKLGYNRNTAHRVVYGPSRYGGLGFRDLFVEQGIGQVQLLVRHLRAAIPPGGADAHSTILVAPGGGRLLFLAWADFDGNPSYFAKFSQNNPRSMTKLLERSDYEVVKSSNNVR
jgi:hypothetical protein